MAEKSLALKDLKEGEQYELVKQIYDLRIAECKKKLKNQLKNQPAQSYRYGKLENLEDVKNQSIKTVSVR